MKRSQELSMERAFLKTVFIIVCTNLNNEKFGLPELAGEEGMSRIQAHIKPQKLNSKSITQCIREFSTGLALKLL